MGKRFDWLNKTKAVKSVKASMKAITKRKVLWIWLQKKFNVLFTSKNQIPFKDLLLPVKIAAHEHLDVIYMTIWKQTTLA